jgi:exosome complex RNA-binding protein Csl4
MYKDTRLWNSRNFQFTFKKKEKFFSNVLKVKWQKTSVEKKKNLLFRFFPKIIQTILIIGCVVSITTERAIVVGLYTKKNCPCLNYFYLNKYNIYSNHLSSISIRDCVSTGDIIIAKICYMNQDILTVSHENLGVLLSIGNNYRFMLPINNYEMMCFYTKVKKFKKVSRLSLW